jgi:GxxExxY protein
MGELIHKDESYKIMGACFEVYKTMGPGFLESVYQECLALELMERGIPFAHPLKLSLTYKGQTLEKRYEADFVCYEKIIVEVKAVTKIINDHRAQTINYLRATGLRLALVVNFSSHHQLEHERLVI